VHALDDLRSDVSFGVRSAMKTPMMTAVLVATLALGIAATSVTFSLVNGFFIRPLAIQDPDRFVRIYTLSANGQYATISYPDFADIRDLRGVFDGALAEEPAPFSMGVAGSYERVWGELLSDGYFQLLGVRPAEGRFFAPDEESIGGEAVVVLSHGLWTQRFGASRAALNTTLLLNGRSFRIIGVAPRSFHGTTLGLLSDLWVPALRERAVRADQLRERRGSRAFFGFAKLQPGVTVAQARGAVDALAGRMQRDYPDTNAGVRFAVLSEAQGRIFPTLRGTFVGAAGVVAAVALVVLLLACVNVAGVLLVRAAARRAEIGVRLALGATRGRIVRQLLTEAGILAVAAGAAGVALAWQATRLMTAVRVTIARGAPIAVDVGADARVLAFSAVVTIGTALLFGLAPAVDASQADVIASLKDGGRRAGGARARMRHLLVAVQVALSMALVAGGGLFLRSLQHARQIDLGFNPDRLVTTSVDISLRGDAAAESTLFWVRAIDAVRRLPRTESASLAARLPLDLGITTQRLAPEGYVPPPGRGWPSIEFATIDTNYLRTLGTPLLAGREFTERDTAASPPVAIVNEVVARQFWPDTSAIGRQLVNDSGRRVQVVGVAGLSKYFSIGEDPRPYVYFPLRQGGGARAMTIVARAAGGDTASYLREIDAAIRRIDPIVPLYDVTTMAGRVAMSMAPVRGGAAALAIVGIVALALTALGLYGVVGQTVAQRTYEIGVRRALGAQDRDVARLVMSQAVGLVVAGIVAGLTAGLASGRLLQRLLYEVDAADPVVFGIAPLILVAACAIAAWVPASRALRIDAAAALRSE
jgi:predicted permease